MTEQPHLEAVFVAADAPETTAYDLPARVAAMCAAGAEVVAEPALSGDETVATVRLRQGVLVGLIA